MYGYIYETKCLVENKYYVGQHSVSKFDPKYLGSGKRLRSAVKKYGVESFEVRIIDIAESQQELDEKELYYIKSYWNKYGKENVYNKVLSCYKMTHEFRKSIYDKHPDYKKKLSDAIHEQDRNGKRHPFWNKHHAEEAKQAMRDKLKGKSLSQEHRQKIANSKIGHTFTSEARKKISDTLKQRAEYMYAHEEDLDNILHDAYLYAPELKHQLKPTHKWNLITSIIKELYKQEVFEKPIREQRKYNNYASTKN